MSSYQQISALLVTLLALALVVHCAECGSPLEKCLVDFAAARAGMDQAGLAMAEEFAKRVGEGRLYKHELHLGSYNRADLAHLNGYLFKLSSLKETGDVDAVIAVLRQLTGELGQQLEVEAGQLVEQQLVPACAKFVNALRGVFEGKLVAEERARLAEEISEHGKTEQVQDFIYGWAHYHTCNLLANGDRSLLIKRIPSRIEDQLRIAARRARRMQQQQQQQPQQQQA